MENGLFAFDSEEVKATTHNKMHINGEVIRNVDSSRYRLRTICCLMKNYAPIKAVNVLAETYSRNVSRANT